MERVLGAEGGGLGVHGEGRAEDEGAQRRGKGLGGAERGGARRCRGKGLRGAEREGAKRCREGRG